MGFSSTHRIYDSAVGPVVDVAERGAFRLLWGLASFLCVGPTLLLIAGLLFVAPEITKLLAGDFAKVDWSSFGFAAWFTLFGWPFTALALARARQMFDSRVHFRVGPGGIDLAQPGAPLLRWLLLNYEIDHWVLPWSDIAGFHRHTYRVNLVNAGHYIVFDTIRGTSFSADLDFFAGSPEFIAQRIVEARNFVPHGPDASSDRERRVAAASDRCEQGLALGDSGRWNEAIECFQNAVQLAPDYGRGWSFLGVSLSRAGRTSEAEDALLKAVELDSDSYVPWNCLGFLSVQLKKRERASQCLERCRQLAPDNPGTLALADCLQNDETASKAAPSEVEPFAGGGEDRVIHFDYVDGVPAWQVEVEKPDDFRGAPSKLDFSLFNMPTGAILSCWLRLYDLPTQPCFVQRAIDLTNAQGVAWSNALSAGQRLLVLLRLPGASVFVELPVQFDHPELSSLIEEGLQHNRGLLAINSALALDDYSAAFNRSIRQDFSVEKAWQDIRGEFDLGVNDAR